MVYREDGAKALWQRVVVDDLMEEGHALWTADLDQDGNYEIYAGFRGGKPGIVRYEFTADDRVWKRDVVDIDLSCQSLSQVQLPDGTTAVLGIGGSSIRMYRFHWPK